MNRKEGRGQSTIIIIHQFSPSNMRQFLNPVLRTPDSMPKIYSRKGDKRHLYNLQDIINSKKITYQRECCDRIYTQNHRSTTEVGVIRRSHIDLKDISRPKMQNCKKANCSCSQSIDCGYEKGKGTAMKKKKLKLPHLKEFRNIELVQPSSKLQKSRKKDNENIFGQRNNTSNHRTKKSMSKDSKDSRDQQIQTQFNHYTPTNRAKAGKESTPVTQSIKTQTKVKRMQSQSNSESKPIVQPINLHQSQKQPSKSNQQAVSNHVSSKRKQSDESHSISSFTLKNQTSNTVFQQIKKMLPKAQKSNRPKSKAYSILSNGLFKIPEEEEYEDYLAYYKPMNSSFNIQELIRQENFHIVPTANHVYFGQIFDRKKNGKGITVSQKEIYEGNYKDNVKISGCEKNRDGRYFGEFVNGKRSGQGRFEWNNGEVFEGEWKQGKKSGFGVWRSPRGDFYQGEWKNNRQNGKGYYIHKGGSKYRGTFKEFLKHGQGEEEFANGDRYIGQYQFGKPHGFGKYIWANGDTYQGDFVQGSREGKGKLKRVTGQIYEGGFKLDLKHGAGKQKYKSGQSFEGEFKDGERFKGKLRTKNGAEILITPN